jgi:hypothetical protein
MLQIAATAQTMNRKKERMVASKSPVVTPGVATPGVVTPGG